MKELYEVFPQPCTKHKHHVFEYVGSGWRKGHDVRIEKCMLCHYERIKVKEVWL